MMTQAVYEVLKLLAKVEAKRILLESRNPQPNKSENNTACQQ